MLSESDITKIKELLYVANDIATKYQKSGLQISFKDDKSPITNADVEISDYITKGLQEITPNIPVISEEGEAISPQKIFWLVDPIDGTRGYIKGEDLYTVNIGLIVDRVPIYGFISVPSSGMIYYTPNPHLLMIECEREPVEYIPHTGKYKAVISHNVGNKVHNIISKYGIREYSILPCSVKFCIIASGEADLYPRIGKTMEWDTAAGHALINAVGGKIYDMDGNILSYGKEGLVNNGFIAYSNRLLKKVPQEC